MTCPHPTDGKITQYRVTGIAPNGLDTTHSYAKCCAMCGITDFHEGPTARQTVYVIAPIQASAYA